jgi:hypothetical protein
MTKFTSLFIALLLLVVGCRSSTEYGDCIGAMDTEDPSKIYSTSARNAVLGIIFFEMVIPPVIWLASDFKCPVGNKENKEKVK